MRQFLAGPDEGSTRHAAAPSARGHAGQRRYLPQALPSTAKSPRSTLQLSNERLLEFSGYPSFAVSELARWEGDLKKYKEQVASDSQLNMADRWSLEQAIGALEDQTRSLQKVYQELGTGLAVP